MHGPPETAERASVRDYLAVERTFLAWVRTGLALMGFGFVVARFGVFLQQLQLLQPASRPSYGISLWFGTLLISAGMVVNLFAGSRYARLVRELDRGGTARVSLVRSALAIALFLALLGLAMAIYLVLVRTPSRPQSAYGKETSMTPAFNSGIINTPSNHSVDQTMERLKTILQTKGVTLFALVDHSGEAEKVGLTMRPTKLLIFGNPKAGTPLMVAAPSSAIDLPLKILVWEDSQGKVWISYNSPAYLQNRHGMPQELLPNIAIVETLATKAGE